MGFVSRGVWVMGYCGCMGYEALFPANKLSGLKNVWNLREYGVCEPWVTRESTVSYKCVSFHPYFHRFSPAFKDSAKGLSAALTTFESGNHFSNNMDSDS